MSVSRIVDHIYGTTRGTKNHQERICPRTVHGVKQNSCAMIANRLYVQHVQNIVNKIIKGIFAINDQAIGTSHVEGHSENATVVFYVRDELLQALRRLQRRIPSLLHNELNTVIRGGIVAGGDLHTKIHLLFFYRMHNQRRRCRTIHKPHVYTVRRKYLCHPTSGGFRKESVIVAHRRRLVGLPFRLHQTTDTLCHLTNITLDKISADHSTPAACTKLDHTVLLTPEDHPQRRSCHPYEPLPRSTTASAFSHGQDYVRDMPS